MNLRHFIASALCLATVAAVDAQDAPSRSPRAGIDDIAWLAGNWVTEPGAVIVEERWTPPAAGTMLAVSRTLKADKMVAFEFLRIVERDGRLIYVAQPGGRPPTEFAQTAVEGQSVTFENPAHDFPKMIRYALRDDGTLEARVSDGGSRAEVFLFKRSP
jgi:hypothetical protein